MFHLAETDPFDTVKINDNEYLLVNFTAVVNIDGVDKTINFQKVSTYKTDKMPNSRVGDLIRSLGLRSAYEDALTGGDINNAIAVTLQAASGRAVGEADFGWTAAFKESQVVYQTAQSKKFVPKNGKGYTRLPWPRTATGAYQPTVADPATGQEKYPNLEIVRFRVPKTA